MSRDRNMAAVAGAVRLLAIVEMVMKQRFTPALDKSGRAVTVAITLPLRITVQ